MKWTNPVLHGTCEKGKSYKRVLQLLVLIRGTPTPTLDEYWELLSSVTISHTCCNRCIIVFEDIIVALRGNGKKDINKNVFHVVKPILSPRGIFR
jgi:hypothetical protein